MPAYFSIVIQIKKGNKYNGFISDLTDVLISNGFIYDRPDHNCGDNSLRDVIEYNSAKMKDDFELGYDEHFSHDFRQIYWKYHNFSEVRQFYCNEKDMDWFESFIIIPEHDFINYPTSASGHPVFEPEALTSLKSLIEAIWRLGFVETIQTELELTEGAATLSALESGECPSAFPFAIIHSDIMNENYKHIFSKITKIERNGLLLERDKC